MLNYYTIAVFLFGAILGSFYNVLIYRLPRDNFFSQLRSHCPQCGAMVPFWLNIPILSWVILRGRTACCQKPLSIQYPLVELTVALGSVAIYLHHPFLGTDTSQNLDTAYKATELIRFIHLYTFASVLVIGSVIDLHHKIIPNVLTVGLIVTTPIWLFLHPELKVVWYHSILGILLGGGLPYTVAWIYWLIRKRHGLGMGDVKLLAGIGGWWGYQAIFPTLLTASVVGSMVGIALLIGQKKMDMKLALPFGPFIALGAMIYVITQKNILDLLIP